MPPQDRVQSPNDTWTPEPELREMPPRSTVASPYPDLNQPSALLFLGLGCALVAFGLILVVIGIVKAKAPLIVIGIVLLLGGVVLAMLYPARKQAHLTRAQNLVTNGTPVIARILSASNMTGDSEYGRSVKYQLILPGGEMAHRDANVDDRSLPRMIPANVTALVDLQSGDAELYCALPFRAAIREVSVPVSPFATSASVTPAYTVQTSVASAPSTAPGAMGTLDGSPVPDRQVRSAPVAPPPPAAPVEPPAPEVKPKTGPSGLPWE